MIKSAEFARRRKQLMRMADEDAILVLPSAPMRVRSHDTHYPYRQDSDFWYLSGFAEPEAVRPTDLRVWVARDDELPRPFFLAVGRIEPLDDPPFGDGFGVGLFVD